MSFAQRLKLENQIFTRAAQLSAPVYGNAGRLICPAQDDYLQALIGVYNAFFYKENQRTFCAQESALEGLSCFAGSAGRVPVLSHREYKFELIVGDKYA